MSTFDSKWGSLPDEITSKSDFYIIIVTQFIITFAVLMTLEPPVVTFSDKDGIYNSKPSFLLVLTVCVACVFTAAIMRENLKVIS